MGDTDGNESREEFSFGLGLEDKALPLDLGAVDSASFNLGGDLRRAEGEMKGCKREIDNIVGFRAVCLVELDGGTLRKLEGHYVEAKTIHREVDGPVKKSLYPESATPVLQEIDGDFEYIKERMEPFEELIDALP